VARREVSLREVGDRAVALGSPGVLVLPADVSKPQECEKFISDTIRYFGRRKSGTIDQSDPSVPHTLLLQHKALFPHS
jgi:hypothetical protein